MEITRTQILLAIPRAPADDLIAAFKQFGITNIERQIDIIAQLAHESGGFTRYVENLNYSAVGLSKTWRNRFANADGTPNAKAVAIARNPERIANAVYCNRLGNGDEASGDGWKYRGRGAIQTTGKLNYSLCGKTLAKYVEGVDENTFVNSPDLMSTSKYAILSAFAFLERNKLFTVTDFKVLTKRINGGLIGYEERMAYRTKLRNACGIL